MRTLLAALTALLLIPAPVLSQTLTEPKTISTSGANCSVATACAVIPDQRLQDTANIGIFIDLGTSGTFNFEGTYNDTVWVSAEDENGNTSVTAEGLYSVVNKGYKSFRVRASALNGNAIISFRRIPGGGGTGGGSTNLTEIGGNTVATGAGVNGTGVLRVDIATDSEVNDDLDDIATNTAATSADVDAILTLLGNGVNVLIDGNSPMVEFDATTLQNAATANGNGNTFTVSGYGTVFFTIYCNTCSGGTAIAFEGTEDGTNWIEFLAQRVSSPYTIANNTTEASYTYWRGPIGAFQHVRARIASYSAGTVTVTARAIFGVIPLNADLLDPCKSEVKTTTAFSQTAAANIVTAHATKKTYVCAFSIFANAAENIALVEDDTTACASPGTNGAALLGHTTVANGIALAAGGGLTFGNGDGKIFEGTNTNRYICVIQDGSDRLNGSVTWVQRD